MDIVYKKVKTKSKLNNICVYPIQKCIEDALQRCNLAPKESAKIFVENIENLYFKGSPLLVTRVLINLIKSSLKYSGNKALIYIWCTDSILFIVDYGKGMDPDVLASLFNHSYTEEKINSGLDLAFCRTVMEELGGSIRCQSMLDKYTEFALIFPKLQKEDMAALNDTKACF